MGTSLAVVLTTLLGGRAFAERHGESPAKVVALHGWGRTRADWNATLQGYDALALDLPGFGATPAPDSGWSTSEYAEWVGECLDEVLGSGGERPVLVGHSFGGRVAVQLAATNPELVRGIVLTGVPLLRPETAAAQAGVRLPRAAVPQQVALHLQRPAWRRSAASAARPTTARPRARCVRCW